MDGAKAGDETVAASSVPTVQQMGGDYYHSASAVMFVQPNSTHKAEAKAPCDFDDGYEQLEIIHYRSEFRAAIVGTMVRAWTPVFAKTKDIGDDARERQIPRSVGIDRTTGA